MKRVSVGQLRQNPAPVIEQIERGESVALTRYRKIIGTISPSAPTPRRPSGAEAMEAFAERSYPDDGWLEELRALREDDEIVDPWERHQAGTQ